MLPRSTEIFHAKGVGTSGKSMIDRYMKKDQVRALLAATRSDTSAYGSIAYPLFLILANFGLRISEALDLQAEDFRYLNQESFFTVARRKKRGNRAMNYVQVNSRERALLGVVLQKLPQRGRLFRFGARATQYLFGYYLSRAGLRNVFSPHALRRFVKGEMDHAGIPEYIARLRLGHALDAHSGYSDMSPDTILAELEKKEPIA